jgi:hypothetical protein
MPHQLSDDNDIELDYIVSEWDYQARMSARDIVKVAVDWKSLMAELEDDSTRIAARAAACNLPYEWVESSLESDDKKTLMLNFPAGRNIRQIPVYGATARLLMDAEFEHWTFLGDYAAFLDRKTGTIEALTRQPGRMPVGIPLQRLMEQLGAAKDPVTGGIDRTRRTDILLLRPPIEGGRIRAEFSPGTPALLALETYLSIDRADRLDRYPTLKIFGTGLTTHDEALTLLTELSTALFFEFDTAFRSILTLAKTRHGEARLRSYGSSEFKKPVTPDLKLPRQKYSREAFSLYTYARSASGMPLLEFLAYYQVMEYYFPMYSRAELIRRFRLEFTDPRFDPNSDADVSRLINVLAGAGRGFLSEMDQLKATLRHCMHDAALREFIEAYSPRQEFLTGKQKLKSVNSLNLNNKQQPLTDQVAERIYQIRCRIVHSKEDGGSQGAEMLLPFGAEAGQLTHDIVLARFVAQKVLIAGARPAGWLR